MSLIDKNEYVGGGKGLLSIFYCSFKFIDDCRHHCITLALKQLDQAQTCCGVIYDFAALFERAGNLIVKLHAVCYKDDLGINNLWIERDCLRQHHHRERFAASLGVPDYSAFAFPALYGSYSVHRFLKNEELLIASDLFCAGLKDHEIECKIQQAFWTTEPIEVFVLGRWKQGCFFHLVEIVTHISETVSKKRGFLI